MIRYVALLRAVNVGGTGKLPMTELCAMCESCGFKDVRTYIASGNVVFKADPNEAAVQARLEAALQAYAGKPVGVVGADRRRDGGRSRRQPFRQGRVQQDGGDIPEVAAAADLLERVTGQAGEEIALGLREVYVHYPDGQADTKLKIPAASSGTARNMNTVAKLAELAR